MKKKEKLFRIFLVIFIVLCGYVVISQNSNYYQNLTLGDENTMSFWHFFSYFLGTGIIVSLIILIARRFFLKRKQSRRQPCRYYPPLPG